MSYSALARKWRPKSFAELKGQNFVATALSNALDRNQLHHAYLFTGTRGIGKTSVARIFAKCLNCEKGVVSEPCNQCSNCKDIDAGRFLDLIEVDAASKTKVEETRDLLDNVLYAPAQGRYKIYLIDEVHMLSGHSFNALLKTLEEPPEHVKFILATTDPERIPVTVLSRCLKFNLRALSQDELCEQLRLVLQQENTGFNEAALGLLAQEAKGSMRDALSLLEQAMSFGQGSVQLDSVQMMLGMQFQQHIPSLLEAIFQRNVDLALKIIDDIAALAPVYENVLEAVSAALYGLSLQSLVSNTVSQLSAIDDNILSVAAPEPEILQLFYQIALMGKKDLAYAPSSRVGFEMTILRMVAFLPVKNGAIEPTRTHTKNMAAGVSTVQSVSHASLSTQSPAAQPASIPTTTPQADKMEPKSKIEPTIESKIEPVLSAAAPSKLENKPKAPSISGGTVPNWLDVVQALPVAGLTKILLKHCSVVSWQENKIELALDSDQEACLNASRQAQIQKSLSDYLGRAIELDITCGAHKAVEPTPMQQAQTQKKQAQNHAENILTQDEKVQSLLDTFGATIEKISTSE